LAFGAHQLPYHPGRIRTAICDGAAVPVGEAVASISELVKEADRNGGVIAVVDPRPDRVISRSYQAFASSLKRGVYVAEAQPAAGLDFERARLILSIGAPILEGSARATQAWVKRDETGALFVHADASFTKTASLADRWIEITPGSEIALVKGLHSILTNSAGPGEVATATGVRVQTVEGLAADLSNRTPALIVGGRPELQAAVTALHELLGSRSAVVARHPPPFEQSTAGTPLAAIADRSLRLAFIETARVEALQPKMTRDGVIVALSAYRTGARFTVPVPAFLESLEEIGTPPDAAAASWGIAPALVAPPAGVVTPEQFVAAISGTPAITREEALRNRACEIHASGRGSCFSFRDAVSTPMKDIPTPDEFWKKLQDGAVWVDDPTHIQPTAYAAYGFTPGTPEIIPPLATKLFRESRLGRT
jgi:hypothetical protein